jgi:hypothetical protein
LCKGGGGKIFISIFITIEYIVSHYNCAKREAFTSLAKAINKMKLSKGQEFANTALVENSGNTGIFKEATHSKR